MPRSGSIAVQEWLDGIVIYARARFSNRDATSTTPCFFALRQFLMVGPGIFLLRQIEQRMVFTAGRNIASGIEFGAADDFASFAASATARPAPSQDSLRDSGRRLCTSPTVEFFLTARASLPGKERE